MWRQLKAIMGNSDREASAASSASSPSSTEPAAATDISSTSSMVYLNNAGQAQLDPVVQKVAIETVQLPPWKQASIGDEAATVIRVSFATLIGAQASEICIVPSTAFAITMAANNLARHQLKDKTGRILVLDDQYPSAVYPWQEICARSDGRLSLDIVPYPCSDSSSNAEACTWTDAILNCLNQDATDGSFRGPILVASLPPLHWSDGSLIDLETISHLCQKRKISLVVDATQAVGILPRKHYDVSTIRPLVLACSVHKWLRGAPGASLMYVDPVLHQDWQPLDQHERSRILPSGGNAVPHTMGPSGYPNGFVPGARKFDSGGKKNPLLLPILRASLDFVVSLDLEQSQKDLRSLLQPLVTWALSRGYRTAPLDPTQQAAHIISIRVPGMSPSALLTIAQQLEQDYGICVAIRCGGFRISPYVLTRPSDIQRLMGALELLLPDPTTTFTD